MRIFALTLILAGVSLAQTVGQSAAAAYTAKNEAARQAFKDGKFNEALRLTLEALEFARSAYGASSTQVAVALNNLGVLYRSQEKYDSAVSSFEESIRIFESKGKDHTRDVVTSYESLGTAYRMAGKNKEAETNFRRAIDLAEASFGPDSLEAYSPTFSAARYYAYVGDLAKGDDHFVKAYRIAYLRKGPRSEELNIIEDTRTCLVLPRDAQDVRRKAFFDALQEIRKNADKNADGPRPPRPAIVSGGVVNGKAISLPKPSYPLGLAGVKRGAVVVRVAIEEDGTVSQARATCGHPDLANPSVKAAFNAKFSPTLLGGQPVRVSGVIVYNFVGP